jgi:hemoglobin
MIKGDINSRLDVEKLVNVFYRKILVDDFLAPNFIKVNWRSHLSMMYNFWCSELFVDQMYSDSALQKHVSLNMNSDQFERWPMLFIDTVDENFMGVKAELAKSRAESIAAISQFSRH